MSITTTVGRFTVNTEGELLALLFALTTISRHLRRNDFHG